MTKKLSFRSTITTKGTTCFFNKFITSLDSYEVTLHFARPPSPSPVGPLLSKNCIIWPNPSLGKRITWPKALFGQRLSIKASFFFNFLVWTSDAYARWIGLVKCCSGFSALVMNLWSVVSKSLRFREVKGNSCTIMSLGILNNDSSLRSSKRKAANKNWFFIYPTAFRCLSKNALLTFDWDFIWCAPCFGSSATERLDLF